MKKIGRTLAVCVTASFLAASAAVSASAASFRDVSGHWAEATINRWVDSGYINGYPDGTFRPRSPITRTEFAVVANNAFHFWNTTAIHFPDVSETFWGYGEIQKAYAAGYMKGDSNGTFRPKGNVTRQEAAVMLANIMGLGFSGSAPYYSDSASISSWARNSVNAVSAAGYMSGYPDGSFRPKEQISRAEVVTMLNKAIGTTTSTPYVPPTQQPSTSDSVQNMTLRDSTLRNTVVSGNLTIPSSMASRSVTLDNVTVRGTLIVEGGGTITADDCSINELRMNKSSATFRSEGSTYVTNTTFRSNGTLEGDGFGKVSVANSSVNTVTIDGEVDTLTLDTDADVRLYSGADIETFEATKNADDALIEISRNARVRNMILRDEVRIAGRGRIDSMTVYVSGVRSEIEPDSLSRRNSAGSPDFDYEYSGTRHESNSSSSSGSSSSSSSSNRVISRDFDGNGTRYRNVTVTRGVKVEDMRVTGNLTIDSDVGNGTVRLEDLEIDGNVYVYGGGGNSVIFVDCDIDGDIISDKDYSSSSQTVALRFDGATRVRGDVRILDDTILDTYSGSPTLDDVTVETRDAELEIGLDVGRLTLERRAEIDVESGSVIDTVRVNSGLSGTSTIHMSGTAKIKTLDARSNVNVTGSGTVNTVNKDSGTTVDLGSGITNTPGDTSGTLKVTLPATASVEVGKTVTLTAKVEPDSTADKTVTWKTDNPAVATVENGVVRGVAQGTANITATLNADGAKSATCKVTVAKAGTLPEDPDDPDAPVEKPKVYPETKNVMKGAKVTLTLKFPENYVYQKIEWAVASGNDFVTLPKDTDNSVSVELSAIKAGTATVKATIKDTGGNLLAEPTSIITVTESSTGENPLQSVAIGWTETGIPINNWSIKPKSNANQLAAILNPQDAAYTKIEWASSDDTIIKPNLDSGKRTYLEAKGADGQSAEITLTVTPETGNAMTAKCNVTISNDAGSNVPVKNVTLDKPRLDLKVGEKETLKATVTPSTAVSIAVKWSSSDPQVASVSANGEVTALKEGKATITATSEADKDKKATCSVTVTAEEKPPVTVTGVTIATDPNELTFGDTTKRLTATVEPAGATAQVRWSTDPTGIIEIAANGAITTRKAGNVSVTATAGGVTSSPISIKVHPKTTIGQMPAITKGIAATIPYTVEGLDNLQSSEVSAVITPNNNEFEVTIIDNNNLQITPLDAADTATEYTLRVSATRDGLNGSNEKSFRVAEQGQVQISLDETSVSMEMDSHDTRELTATVTPADTEIEWFVDAGENNNIELVEVVPTTDPKKVTIKSKENGVGTVTVVAREKDGTEFGACTVLVTPYLTISHADTLPSAEPDGTLDFRVQVKPRDVKVDYGVVMKGTEGPKVWEDHDVLSGDDFGNDDSAVFTLTIPSTATAGDYTLNIVASKDSSNTLKTEKPINFKVLPKNSQTATVTITSPENTDVAPGGTVEYTYEVNPTDAAVAFKFTMMHGSEVLEGTDWDDRPVDDRQQGKIIVNVPSDAPAGTYTLKVENDEGSSAAIAPPNLSFTVTGTGITLSEKTLELKMGEPKTLTATTNSSGQEVTWTSNNEAVVKVDGQGTVTTVAPGTATITAAVGSQTATCQVTVKPTVTIDTENIKVERGKTTTFHFTATPAEKSPDTRISIDVSKGTGTSSTGDIPETTWIGGEVTIKAKSDAALGTYHLTVKVTSNGQEASASTTFEVIEAKDTGTGTGDTPTESSNESQPNAAAQAVRQNTVQTVQKAAPRTFSFIPQRELQTSPVVQEPIAEKIQTAEKEPERSQEPENVQEPVKEPETAQEPEKVQESEKEPVQEPEKAPEQAQGIALTCADSFKAGETLALSGTVNGVSGALRKIEWSIRDADATGATIRDGALNAEQAGTVTVAATVQNSGTTQFFTITVLPGDEPKTDETVTQGPQNPAVDGEPTLPAEGENTTANEGQTGGATAPTPLVQIGTVTLPNGQVIANAKKLQRNVGAAILLSALDALPANAAADSVVWKVESLGTTGAALQAQDNTLVNVNATGVILLSRTLQTTGENGKTATTTTYYEITIVQPDVTGNTTE